jgi:CRISPR-associated protein Cas1
VEGGRVTDGRKPLTPRRGEGKVAYVSEWGSSVRAEKGVIRCYLRGEVKWEVPAVELEAVVFLVTASLSTEVIRLCQEYGIDVVFLSGNRPFARIVPSSYTGSPRLWVRQLTFKGKHLIAREIASAKLHNQAVTLRYYLRKYGPDEEPARKLEALSSEVKFSSSREEVMAKEAEGARTYWGVVASLLPGELGFRAREKRGAKDPFNVALNMGYGVLKAFCWRAVFTAGLLPHLGVLHAYRAGRPSLVLDLMEEFRSPFVDRPLLALARSDPPLVKSLGDGEGGRFDEARKRVYREVTEAIREEEVTTQARRLANAILGAGEYRGYRTR